MLLDGKKYSQEIFDKLKAIPSKYKTKKLVIISYTGDEASKVYVRNKIKKCEYCNIPYEIIYMDENSTTEEYLEKINELNIDNSVKGIIVQLPLPPHVDSDVLVNSINPDKDVDGFIVNSLYDPCTPTGIIDLIKYYKGNNWICGKNAVVIGRSKIVGAPMAELLLKNDATVTVCHTKTNNIKYYTQNADIVVVATGHQKTLTPDMVRAGTMIIDVGMNRNSDGKLCGDTFGFNSNDYDLTPVPGGVGPMTVATLISRIVDIKEISK